MSSIAYLTLFTPYFTLHNSSAVLNKSFIQGSGTAAIDYIELPNYVRYDPTHPDETAPIVPGDIEAVVILKGTPPGPSDFIVAVYESMVAAIGKQGTLVGTSLAGNTLTCTARLRTVENVSPYPTATQFNQIAEVRLVFVPKDNWA